MAERFSEEDLSRFMQIMLRTHSELGYKQEQRFHLELGLLKLVHVQRLLPLEELLSGEVPQVRTGGLGSGSSSRPASEPARRTLPSAQGSIKPRLDESQAPSSRATASSPFARPSPFEADRLRKSEPKAVVEHHVSSSPFPAARAAADTPATSSASVETVATGAVATVIAEEAEPAPQAQSEAISVDALRNGVLAALEDAGQHVLAHHLEEGEWLLRGGEVSAKVGMSQVLIEVALGAEAKRMIQAALRKAANRPLKFKMVSGAATAEKADSPPRPTNGAGARSRALADPLVQRMQEKFGAEIRTVIDQKNSG
jgi:DNA polymerase-3 subunit gamma/tau